MRIEVDCALARVVEYTPEELEFVNSYLTFADPQARFTNGNPIVELLNRIDNSFPSGFAGKVKKAGATRTHLSGRLDPIEVELVDVRQKPPARVQADLSFLRDYQVQAVETALTRTRGIVQMPTGSGKSVCAAGIIASVPEARWLILVPQSDLLEQFAKHVRERLGVEPGIIGDGVWNPQQITVATFQTLSRRMTKAKDKAAYAFMRSVQGMIVDECFPAGTLVGGRPIESLKVGDLVPSYDEAAKALVERRVVRTFRKKPSSLVSVHLADGRTITCTEEHPFLIESGEWLPAKSISGQRVLWYPEEVQHELPDSDGSMHTMRNANSTQEHSSSEGGVLHALSDRAARGAAQAGCLAMPHLRCSGNAIRQCRTGEGQERSELLQSRSQEAMGGGASFCACVGAGSKERREVVCANEGAQSNAASRNRREDAANACGKEASPSSSRRERQAAACATSDAVGCAGTAVVRGVCDNNQEGIGTAQCDQVRLGAARREASGGGRWAVPQYAESPREGCPQDRVPRLIRVDRVEVHQPTSDGGFGGLCSDGHVYNIEVEGTHTYLVDGVVVHNCQQVASGTFSFVCSKATNAYYRIGISATPLDRSDKKAIFVLAQLGGIIHKTSSAELRARGFLADATIKMVRVEQGTNAPTWQGVYGECVVRSKVRNMAVARMAQQAAKPALVFVNQVSHGRNLLGLVKKLGMRAELVWGEDDTDERRQAIKDLVEGRLDVIVCSNVFAQGVDIPSLASVVNAAAGQSVILTLQRLGRATRVTADKTSFEAWDVLDDGNRYLAKHGRARQQVYEREGFKVQVMEADQIGVEKLDPRKDEHGFTLGSAAQAAYRAELRREAMQSLAGIEKLRNPKRGKVLRAHEVVGYACTVCGAPTDNLPPECLGYHIEEEAQRRLI